MISDDHVITLTPAKRMLGNCWRVGLKQLAAIEHRVYLNQIPPRNCAIKIRKLKRKWQTRADRTTKPSFLC